MKKMFSQLSLSISNQFKHCNFYEYNKTNLIQLSYIFNSYVECTHLLQC